LDRILVAAGDGIGPEVIEATLYVMDGLDLDLELYIEPVGMAGVEERGSAMADDTLEIARDMDAILFGAVETPPPDVEYRSPLLTLRKELDLYANVRPARPLIPAHSRIAPEAHDRPLPQLDVVIVRENTEGLYVRREHEIEDGVMAERVITRKASERIHQFAFEWARAHGRRKVTCVHKANLLRKSDGLFLETFKEVAGEVAGDIEISDMHVDAMAAAMVTNPWSQDVLVTPNLYGDILSDLAAGLCGGLGLAPSGSYGEGGALFEPVHGSAPDIAGKGIADPVACILSGVMMLEHLGHSGKARRLEEAVLDALASGVSTPELGGEYSTLGFAEEIRERL